MNRVSVLFYIFIIILASCTPVKKVIYFQEGRKNIIDSSKTKIVVDTARNKFAPDTANNKFELKIYPGAILAITVFTANSEAIAYFTPIGPIPADPRSGYERGYVVDVNGNTSIPLLGQINLSGLTLIKAQDTISALLKLYVDDPIVSVKLLSFKFTVLGEVNKPGQYFVNQEKITFSEALGVAGDLTPYGRRTNIKLIRYSNNKPIIYNIDLTTTQALSQEFMYVFPDDLIYVEPVKRKNFLTEAPVISIFTGVISTGIVLLSFLLTKK
jgi:polysaccharide export outer membrane protein